MTSTTYTQPLFLDFGDEDLSQEDPNFLSRQLVTYIGNKRGLAKHLELAIATVRKQLGGRKITTLDLFAGTGFVSRLMKRHSSSIIANDLEAYSSVLSRCYLSNADTVDVERISDLVSSLNERADSGEQVDGFFQELYAPKDDHNIQIHERVFYTADNARRLDFFSQSLESLPMDLRTMLLGPLLSRASIHANTSGVFKGFYKDKETGVGKFGGSAADALTRILEPIRLEVPILSFYSADSHVHSADSNALIGDLPEVDLAYIDPPYNQHPYGSNYFMLNLLADYRRPESVSEVSGIPTDWKRSGYNVKKRSFELMRDLIERTKARYLLISFNAEGYVEPASLRSVLETHGNLQEIVIPYNTFRGSRNLRDRPIHVNEHLFLLEKS